MENVVASKPKGQKENINKILCSKCEKEIKDEDIDNAFKITMGLMMKNDFFPADKTVYFHRDCL